MTNLDQQAFWTDSAGPAWVALQREMDTLLAPVLDVVMTRAKPGVGERVLDIGCGTGDSVARIAQAVGPSGHVTGLDISETMLRHAHDRLGFLPQARLLLADAQTHRFEQGYDVILSRFGVMFFDDTATAFHNLWSTLLPGGRMVLAAWGAAPDNPWFMEPAAAARDVLGPVPKVDRTLPGPFAFEDADGVLATLRGAGVTDPTVETLDLMLTPHGTLADAAELCCHIGPADSALQYHEADAEGKAAVKAAIIGRFAKFDGPNGIHIPAVIHVFEARKPS
ncbi:class I SAM-dependent methyltransferase [uncultured Tateyamaria sp.]|uniref:class I SAM-dependent methyltransferase n=1 Tax=Tateyamaria sp. 1078 TaxID=3417464 RepID=UPI002637A938|nr:class I SAM-dependent methyltransferase [uncultured Tateyamaria sp.]